VSPALTYTGGLTPVRCWCGIRSAVPAELYREARRTGQEIFCPLGHSFIFGDSQVERLERELTAARDAQARLIRQRDHAQHQARAQKGVATKLRRRAAKGVCPCCNRQFADMARHMATKHPAFVAETNP